MTNTGVLRKEWDISDTETRIRMIVDIARRLLKDEGIDNVSMRKIAAGLGVGAMTLYSYIESQDELLIRIAEEGFAELENIILAAWKNREDKQLGMISYDGLKAYLDFAENHPHLFELMFSSSLISAERKKDFQRFLPFVKQFYRFSEQLLAAEGFDADEAKRDAALDFGIRWAFIHGLASLVTTNRIQMLKENPRDIIDRFFRRLYPDWDID